MSAGNNMLFMKKDASLGQNKLGLAFERGRIKAPNGRVRACFFESQIISDHINKQLHIMNLEDDIDNSIWRYLFNHCTENAHKTAKKEMGPMFREVNSLVTRKEPIPQGTEELLFDITLAMARVIGTSRSPEEQKAGTEKLQELFKTVSKKTGVAFEVKFKAKDERGYALLTLKSKEPRRTLTYGWKNDGSHALISNYDGKWLGQSDYYPNMTGNCRSMDIETQFLAGSHMLFGVQTLLHRACTDGEKVSAVA